MKVKNIIEKYKDISLSSLNASLDFIEGGKKMKEIDKFFVYGTLKQGYSNSHLIPKESIVSIKKSYLDDHSIYQHPRFNYPCMVEEDGRVFGELVEIKEEYLKDVLYYVDRLEGFCGEEDLDNNYYNRKIRKVTYDGKEVEAYVYIFNTKWSPLFEKIEDGIFLSGGKRL